MNVQSTQDGQTNKKIRCLNENSPEGYLYLQMETQKKTMSALDLGPRDREKEKAPDIRSHIGICVLCDILIAW